MSNADKDLDLTREQIVSAMQAISDELGKQGSTGEICLFGGAVMVLAFNARLSTRDVDAIFQPTALIRNIAAQIGEQHAWKPDWMNDGVKGFVSSNGELTSTGLPQFPNLRLIMPTAEYLLAMKCMAARTGGVDEKSDVPDIVFLIRSLNLKSAGEVLDVVAKYYGDRPIAVKSQYLIEGLFEEGRV